ncbi:hypothetical protein DFA_03336 [Cavenderia fasciculata]|uniref:NECAP PHear domain-containing protein n=1 Tax=Cavenderia fasciculata TaxID=261658 RepID=F4PHA6_CACFS|nr:uncharacterized protein DFA_03336 [Cavenderia fasciculata]EGG25090.1 hypothetical protein DFA_03336 [Cavenderia fasciculata]|eukprot:XP_004362941.1 hypothetical protein DFA_03336 [Cavenderia fasciculata]
MTDLIPPRPNAAGYKAQDWDPESYIWSGRLVIIGKGDKCTIKFEEPNGEIFAQCPVEPNAVEPVIDSSRYFVIKIKNGDRHALVGMGFTDRSDAFDFNATLQDQQNYVKNKKQSELARQQHDNQPKIDYSLKSGQTIHIPFNKASPTTNTPPAGKPSFGQPAAGASSGGGFLLSPPPPSGTKSRPPAQQQQQPQQQQSNNNNNNPFGTNDFGSSTSFF